MKLENADKVIGKPQILLTASKSRLFRELAPSREVKKFKHRYWIRDSEISNGNMSGISLYAEMDCVQPVIDRDINNTIWINDMLDDIHSIH